MKKQSVYLHTNGYYDYLVTNHSGDLIDHVERKEGHFFTSEELNEYTQKVIKHALETATENVQTKWNGDFIEIPVGTVTVDKE